jgi:hypothetical protein
MLLAVFIISCLVVGEFFTYFLVQLEREYRKEKQRKKRLFACANALTDAAGIARSKMVRAQTGCARALPLAEKVEVGVTAGTRIYDGREIGGKIVRIALILEWKCKRQL